MLCKWMGGGKPRGRSLQCCLFRRRLHSTAGRCAHSTPAPLSPLQGVPELVRSTELGSHDPTCGTEIGAEAHPCSVRAQANGYASAGVSGHYMLACTGTVPSNHREGADSRQQDVLPECARAVPRAVPRHADAAAACSPASWMRRLPLAWARQAAPSSTHLAGFDQPLERREPGGALIPVAGRQAHLRWRTRAGVVALGGSVAGCRRQRGAGRACSAGQGGRLQPSGKSTGRCRQMQAQAGSPHTTHLHVRRCHIVSAVQRLAQLQQLAAHALAHLACSRGRTHAQSTGGRQMGQAEGMRSPLPLHTS